MRALVMSWKTLFRHSRSLYRPFSRPLCPQRVSSTVASRKRVFTAPWRVGVLLGSRVSSAVASRKRVFTAPWRVGVLLGSGIMGGVSLTLIKYLKYDRTSSCQSQSVTSDHRTVAAETTVQELGFIHRLRLGIRFVYLCVVFSPVVILYTLSRLLGDVWLANSSWQYVLFALQRAGPAFVKLGQWASTRRDIFSKEFCDVLSGLHLHCYFHSWEETDKLMEASFGPNWQQTICIEDHSPIGSGCIAQVYQGKLYCHGSDGGDGVAHGDCCVSNGDGTGVSISDCSVANGDGTGVPIAVPSDGSNCTGVPIAIKVLHPNIVGRMEQDIFLMKYVASWIDTVYPAVHWVAFTECVDEFSIIMTKQLNMKQEAVNLGKFKDLMINSTNIKFPTPFYPYVTRDVLVESFEAGDQISGYLGEPGGELQKCLARVGIEALLDMLFVHNFVHGDLHPGNILVQQDSDLQHPTLVMLDCGIATSLSPADLENLLCVFTAIVTGQGWKVADLFLNQKQSCSAIEEFRSKVGMLVDSAVKDLNLKEVKVDTLFSNLFSILIEHKVRIDPNFTSVMMAMMIIEGLGRSLDPSLDILTFAKPCVLNRAKKALKDTVRNRLKMITHTS